MSDATGMPERWEAVLSDQVRRSSRLLFKLAYGILRDAAAAEDICQQAFMRAWQQQDRIRDSVALQAWLSRVVVNDSLQLIRRRQTERRAQERLSQAATYDSGRATSLEWRELLHAGMTELSDRTRMVVLLRLVEGASGAEVKSRLGISESEVSRRLHQGLEHLRRRVVNACMTDR